MRRTYHQLHMVKLYHNVSATYRHSLILKLFSGHFRKPQSQILDNPALELQSYSQVIFSIF